MQLDMQRDTAHIHPLQRSAYSKAVVAELFAQMTVTKALRTDWFKCAASFRLRRSPAVSRYQSFGDYLLCGLWAKYGDGTPIARAHVLFRVGRCLYFHFRGKHPNRRAAVNGSRDLVRPYRSRESATDARRSDHSQAPSLARRWICWGMVWPRKAR